MLSLEERLEAVEIRNQRVEADKAWEGSWARRLLIMGLTYLLVASYISYLGVGHPWKNAWVPVIGFFLSTLTLDLVKRRWIARRLHG